MYNRNVCRDSVISAPQCGVPDNYPRVNHGFDDIDLAGRNEASREWEESKRSHGQEPPQRFVRMRFADSAPPAASLDFVSSDPATAAASSQPETGSGFAAAAAFVTTMDRLAEEAALVAAGPKMPADAPSSWLEKRCRPCYKLRNPVSQRQCRPTTVEAANTTERK
jgi:hypothetical protein